MNSTDQLAAEEILGEDAKRFIHSDLGRLVLGFARQEVDLAVEALLNADPSDYKAIRAIQLQAQMGAKFEAWLRNIIAQGEQSSQALHSQYTKD